MNNRPFDPSKPVQTRDGRPAVVHAQDLRGAFPILATVYDVETDCEIVLQCRRDGSLSFAGHISSSADLVNVPAKHTRELWINFYSDGEYCYPSIVQAEVSTHPALIVARKKVVVEFEEGEGL